MVPWRAPYVATDTPGMRGRAPSVAWAADDGRMHPVVATLGFGSFLCRDAAQPNCRSCTWDFQTDVVLIWNNILKQKNAVFPDMAEITLAIAALAGLGSFVAPCILPMIPAFIAYISGTTLSDLKPEQGLWKQSR